MTHLAQWQVEDLLCCALCCQAQQRCRLLPAPMLLTLRRCPSGACACPCCTCRHTLPLLLPLLLPASLLLRPMLLLDTLPLLQAHHQAVPQRHVAAVSCHDLG
jgi:hypothetical protein